MPKISIVGLGAMGSTIADLFVDKGYDVTVWNRSSEKARPLISKGATLASSPAQAVSASPVTIVCVLDYPASSTILETPEVSQALEGKSLVQLTTGSPQEALACENWVLRSGGEYLDGAIQVAPSHMGKAETSILFSGSKATFNNLEAHLKVLGGGLVYLGESASAAATMDLATLSYIYGALLGFFQGARVAESQGMSVEEYAKIVAEITPTFGPFLRYQGEAIQSANFAIAESPMRISVEATQRLLSTARQMEINHEIPTLAADLFKRADLAGLGGEEIAALIKVLRGNDSA